MINQPVKLSLEDVDPKFLRDDMMASWAQFRKKLVMKLHKIILEQTMLVQKERNIWFERQTPHEIGDVLIRKQPSSKKKINPFKRPRVKVVDTIEYRDGIIRKYVIDNGEYSPERDKKPNKPRFETVDHNELQPLWTKNFLETGKTQYLNYVKFFFDTP